MQRKFTAIILLNILAALLFSSSEGVRLLPFPDAESDETSRSTLQKENEIPYQPNVIRFDSGKTKTQTNAERQNYQKIFSGNIENFEEINVFSGKYLTQNDVFSLFEFFQSDYFALFKTSRAPPFFS